MQQRYYDSVIGRFYSNNPIGCTGVSTFNRYSYVGNNPYKYTDPTGMTRQSSYDKCEDDPNCTNVIKNGSSNGRESRGAAVKRISGEIYQRGDFKSKGEADWLHELNDDENLTVTVKAAIMTVKVLSPWRLDSNGGYKANAIILGDNYIGGENTVHGKSTIRHRPNGTYGIYDGRYNFEMHSLNNVMRNIATLLGAPISGAYHNIHYEGNVGVVIPYNPE